MTGADDQLAAALCQTRYGASVLSQSLGAGAPGQHPGTLASGPALFRERYSIHDD
jgi:hypothetical protein